MRERIFQRLILAIFAAFSVNSAAHAVDAPAAAPIAISAPADGGAPTPAPVAAPAPAPIPAPAPEEKVLFNRDVRPILSDTCFKCHGPDANTRKSSLRLDTLEGAMADLGEGHGAIVPGNPEASEGFKRLISADPDEKMPPVDSGIVLTEQQINTIRRWIAQGAAYEPHWSLVAPVAPTEGALPEVKATEWVRNPIDRFILNRLEREGLPPNPEADRTTLIRRLSLDLTGLPPTPVEVDSFLTDQSPDAYEKVVDRLLGSQRYGERMAMRWLDLARYGDTNGYQVDTERAQWRWRDWVIEAFNRNQRFDEFTVEQLAGDLMPNATLDQRIASGFNRNHRITLEGGVIPEEYRVEYVVDRVETTATTWLGLTMGCARCHDHKYDPISQKDFYRFYAFFNSVPENGIDGANFNSVPLIPAPVGVEAQKQLTDLDAAVAAADAAMAGIEPGIAQGIAAWEQSLEKATVPPALRSGLVAHVPFDGTLADSVNFFRGLDYRGSQTPFVPGPLAQAGEFDGQRFVDLPNTGAFERTDAFSFGAWVFALDTTNAGILAKMDESKDSIGYNLYWLHGQVHLQFLHNTKDNLLALVTAAPVSANAWHHIFATYDGSGKAAGAKLYIDGKPVAMNTASDTLTASIATDVPLRIGGRTPGVTKFNGKIDDVRVYNRVLAPEEVDALGGPRMIAANIPAALRTAEQSAAIRSLYLENGPQEHRDIVARVASSRAERQKVLDVTPTVMVMQDMPTPRETFVLQRGAYDMPGEKVTAGVPAALPALPAGAPLNRLTLAQWLVDPKHPLMSRVTVNRYWENYFGAGIVKSTEDFGMQSEWPSHPDLLDWLATEFIRTGWDIKAMQKLIVTSATYRQAANVRPDLLERDPDNRLLARGPRLRLPAEMIRDQALASSGMLVEKLGGPSVRPYQPPGIWEEVTSGGEVRYVQDKGEALYRRSLYTFWKRTVPPPTMSVFDAPTREVCTVRRSRTNTPLQALALLNDTVFVEASRKLAERAMSEGGVKPADRITHAFRLAVARKPTETELKILLDGFNFHLATYFSDPDAAAKRLTIGESTKNPNFDPRELAAYTSVASVIMNMDQTITRE